ncbi:MAG TPA: DUF4349 domain-containing protein [Burkholderiaceae bacterium]|nr:DUF4349 domain-containing protein [Burkholderiaceae bacterium]
MAQSARGNRNPPCTFSGTLRCPMATPGAQLKDLIEVERELVRVQSELDSLAARRKGLADQTDKVHVSLSSVHPTEPLPMRHHRAHEVLRLQLDPAAV